MPAPKGNANAVKDYTGCVFGYLTVIGNAGWAKGSRQRMQLLRCRCVCGKEIVRRRDSLFSYSSCRCKQVRARFQARGFIKPGAEATEHPSIIDIAWAAGIFEGEGSITGGFFVRKLDGKRMRQIQATIAQKDPWLVNRFKALFGGDVRLPKISDNQRMNLAGYKRSPVWIWTATGARARGFLMTIWKFLSSRRHEQILKDFSFYDPIPDLPVGPSNRRYRD